MISIIKKQMYVFCIGLLLLSSCRDLETNNPITDDDNDGIITQVSQLDIPEGFDFNTTQGVSVNLSVKNAENESLSGISIHLYTADPEEGGQLMTTVRTDSQGQLITNLNIPTYQESLFIVTEYPGIPNITEVPVGPSINYTLGGDKSNDETRKRIHTIKPKSGSTKANSFTYLGTFNVWGLPNYLESPGDAVSQEIVDNVNASLPESKPVPTNNPQYLDENIISNINLRDSADVWVTFVHEGAGWRNALGYYTYTIGNPPASIDDIDTLNIIFPNVSYVGSGGAMLPGDKAYLGKFPPNTSIGWFLVPNAWNGNGVTFVSEVKFSDSELNTFTTDENKRHIVLLRDDDKKLLLLGMEDTSRPSGDKDFNDAVFYVTANPYSAIVTDNLNEVTKGCDDVDNDDVCDSDDDYPSESNKAYNNYIPSQNSYATLAFEDLWPQQGDYDFNDLVVNYQLNAITNASNQVVELQGQFITRASGANFENGFAFELPIAASNVNAVTGSSITENFVSLAANGTEANQTNAVIIVYDNIYNQIIRPGSFYFNTQLDAPAVDPDTVNITVTFSTPVSLTDIQGFNPFVISNKRRGYEIHLLGKTPTDLANTQLFGTSQDRTNPSENKYYQTESGLPFGITLPNNFEYPRESKEILEAHKKFADWIQSGGVSFTDWYLDLPDYRNSGNIYKK